MPISYFLNDSYLVTIEIGKTTLFLNQTIDEENENYYFFYIEYPAKEIFQDASKIQNITFSSMNYIY